MYYIGLMSGTSMDAADAVVAEFPDSGMPRICAAASLPMPAPLRTALQDLIHANGHVSLTHLGTLHERLGMWFADAAQAAMDKAGIPSQAIGAIGNHGQTVRHEPDNEPAFSMQLGSGSRIAAATGCTVVTDFRNADMALGGQGAPLVPAFHRAIFSDAERGRVVLNIGGIANITVLPASKGPQGRRVTGFDTGPGNTLMDGWTQKHLHKAMDVDGQWAASGCVDATLLEHMLGDSYLARRPPKSTGREYFNQAWLNAQLAAMINQPAPQDTQATLCAFTAQTIASAINACGPAHNEVVVCGGGARNTHLLHTLSARMPAHRIYTSARYGVAPEQVEATAFAWLAKRRLQQQPGNLPAVTGARRPAILGAVYAP